MCCKSSVSSLQEGSKRRLHLPALTHTHTHYTPSTRCARLYRVHDLTVVFHLVDGAEGGGVVVQVVGVDSEFGAELQTHVADPLLCAPLLQPGLQLRLEHPGRHTHPSGPHTHTHIFVLCCMCVPVDLQYLSDRAEDDVDVPEAEDGAVGVQRCRQRLQVDLQHRGRTRISEGFVSSSSSFKHFKI